jgi:hypothetical protein
LTEPVLESGTLLADRYRIEDVLGAGGMGRVYRARDETLDRPVALKVMHAAMVMHAARFEREARAGAALTHPAVVRVLAFGRLTDGRPYLAFEFVEGSNVSARLRTGGPFPPEGALALVRPIAGALAEAHAKGVIHRDLKPENLMLTQALGMPEALRLLDFGIAGLASETDAPPVEKLTVTGQVFGTPEYMAPEQAMGRRTSPATDIWAFGATLHALLTGRSPFAGAHVPEVLYRVVNASPAALPEGTPPAVVELIAKCLSKNPADRPADGSALLAVLPAPPVDTSPAPAPAMTAPAAVLPRTPPKAALVLSAALGLLGGVVLGRASSGPDGEHRTPAPVATGDGANPAALPDDTGRARVLTALAAGRLDDAVPDLRVYLAAVPAAASEPALVAAVLDAFATRDGTPLAEFVGGPFLPAARERLLTLAASPDARLRWRAVRSFPPESPDARAARIQALRQDLKLPDCDARKRTVLELAEMGDAAVIPDIRAMRQRFNFLDNLCLGDVDDTAIRRLRR